ncbi:ABC transporter ATP-binding protein [Streptomyces europaeiscabiei]|uniref:ABC transporter ATP-binding protein n=1 Tax=Streptomyces europaeiscabiei TaxID=146819 RepID=UPI0029A2B0EB|nr:ABC transporter ATP-binding protein [Streptomyces europaeiscabiei]MDX2760991.1 ABC transporter ATP-binding protein [Streptomyces europaeiscabiei]MDX2769062.1 ABC transporter ATP-binding protein [Streptomyces europaeiscabiei]
MNVSPPSPSDVVEVRDLVVRYGAATALDSVSLRVAPGEMVALVGPNGAGKSTLVNTLTGILTPASGSVEVRARIAQVPEGRQMFGDLTVDDNLRLGAWQLSGRGRSRRKQRDTSWVYELLPDLVRVRDRKAGGLSGGQQQMVAVGRALMSRPEVLVIDELSLGLAPLIVADLAEHLTELNREQGTAVVLIEQNARLALDLCSRAYVLEAGRIAAEGDSANLAASPDIARAYLGEAQGLPSPQDAQDDPGPHDRATADPAPTPGNAKTARGNQDTTVQSARAAAREAK